MALAGPPRSYEKELPPRLFSHQCVERLYEKVSNTGKPPRHEADHGSVHQRLAARTRPLVVFAHPPVLVEPRKCPLYYPSTRQHLKAFRGHKILPIDLHALFGPLLGPRPHDLFGSRLARTLQEIHTPPQGLLYPVLALILSTVACVQPQMREARERLTCVF